MIITEEMMLDGWNYIIIAIELIHGTSFAFSWAAGMDRVQKLAPNGKTSTFVAVFCSLFNNAGGCAGMVFGGFIYENYGYFFVWTLGLLLVFVDLISVFANKH